MENGLGFFADGSSSIRRGAEWGGVLKSDSLIVWMIFLIESLELD